MFGRSSKVAPSLAATPGTPDLSSTTNAAAASPTHSTTGHGSSIVVSCGAAGAFEPRTRLRILIGDGQQSVKWLALTAARMLTGQRDTHGRVQARAPVGDGRLVTSCLPQNVFVSRQRKWVHPHTTVHALVERFGRAAQIQIELELKPHQENGCHVRTVWGDLAFGGDKGEERYQNWVAERRAAGAHNAMSDDEEEEEEGKGADGNGLGGGNPASGHGAGGWGGDKTAAELAEEALKAEFAAVWSHVSLSCLINVEAEKLRISEYMYPHFSTLKKVFFRCALAHLKSAQRHIDRVGESGSPATANDGGGINYGDTTDSHVPRLLLPDVVHFSWQHELDMCCTGLRRTVKDQGKILSNQLEEETFVRACAEEVMVAARDSARGGGGGAVAAATANNKKMAKNDDPGATNAQPPPTVSLSLPNFLEFLVRYTVRRKEKGGGGGGASGAYASAIALRQMLQRLAPTCNRRENEKVRKILVTKSISRVVAESLVPVRQVFDHYATAELQKNRKDDRYKAVLLAREFRLLMTDALLIGARPGDDSAVAKADCSKAFFSCQANDASSAIAFGGMTKEERASSSNVLEDITFAEFLEAVARVALAKWDDDEIPHLDKIQLALEAVAVMVA
jgi:hypothetical protein